MSEARSLEPVSPAPHAQFPAGSPPDVIIEARDVTGALGGGHVDDGYLVELP